MDGSQLVDSNTATVSITVSTVNDPPVANDQALETDEDTPLPLTLTGSDVEGDTLTYEVVTQPVHGSLSGVAPNLTYTPAFNYNGSDVFTYKANDGLADSNIVTVSITVRPVNNAPVCANTAIVTDEDTLGTVAPSCTDVDSATLTYAIDTQPSNGAAVVEDGLLKYTPSANFNGSDSFTYTANDGTATSAPATVLVTVNAVNDAPAANSQSLTINEDVPLDITLTGSDIENDPLTFTVIGGPTHGTLSGDAPNLTYTPEANWSGADGFTFKVNDGAADSPSATVEITVNTVNDPPVANNDSYTTDENVQLHITAVLGVLANDTDVDGDSLTASVLTGPAHGTLSLDVDGSFIYTPDSGYSGPDGFTYTASDGQGGTANADVLITVNPVNYPPVSESQTKTTDEDVAVSIVLTATDADNNSLSYTVIDSPLHGTLTGTAPNLTYTPNANYICADSFSFKANDGQADSNVAVVSLTVNPVNDPPVVVGQSITASEDTAQNVTLSGSDVYGDALTYQIVTAPAHGTLSGSAPNIVYAPELNYGGPDSFTFKANDGTTDSHTATVNITVTPVNDPPIANNQSITTVEDTATAATLTASDVENNLLTYTVLTGPAHGVLSGAAPNLTYAPALNFNGLDSFTFKVNDGTADSNIATVSITVTPVNDAPIATNDSATTLQDTPVIVSVLANDTDVDGNLLTVTAVTGPAHGSAVINANNTVTYTPATGWFGADNFTYTISDGNGGTASATVSITVAQNDLIFKDGFGSCNASAWSGTVGSGLSFPTTAAYNSNCGMAVNITSNSPAYVRDDTPNAETRYRARFYFNPNGIVMGKGDSHVIFGAYSTAGNNMLVVELRRNGSSFQIRAGSLNDRGKWSDTGWSTILSGWNAIEFDWRAATAAGANNGGLTLWLNGAQVAYLTGIDNDQKKVDWIALGAVNGIDSRTRGTYYFDEFESRRSNYIGN